jgi:hypothetical protein
MKPRGFWGTFVFVAAITALPFALLSSWIYSLTLHEDFGFILARFGIWGGVAFGLLFGFVMAFFLKAETIVVPFQDWGAFLANLNVVLAEMGYHPESQSGQFMTFRPSFQAGLLAGKISVQIGQNNATIVGPAMYVKKLKQRIQ